MGGFALLGACLACSGWVPVTEPTVPPIELAPSEAAPSDAAPSDAAPEAAPSEATAKPADEICCSMRDHAEWTSPERCAEANGERWWRYDLCGNADATSALLEPTAEVPECGYTHRQDGTPVLFERVSIDEAVVTLKGVQRRLKRNATPAFEGPPGGYTYEDRDDDLRVDVLRDEVNETATLDVYWGGWLEHRSTRTTFLPCGD